MRISLVVPTLWVEPEKNMVPMLKSFSGQYDEIIIVDDNNIKLSQKINKGLKKATGDYIVVVNDDITLKQGTIKQLCDEDQIISPSVRGSIDKLFHAHMWAMHKSHLDKIGYFDEEFPNAYWIDSDYWMRIREAGLGPDKNSYVIIDHPRPSATIKTLNITTDDGKDLFIKKHGREALNIVL